MLYLDYAKQTENGYIMNFFANSVEDLEDISEGKEFVTKNGTNYGVPAPQSVVTITNRDGEKTTYLMGEDGNWIPGVVNPTDYYTKKQTDAKLDEKEDKITDINLTETGTTVTYDLADGITLNSTARLTSNEKTHDATMKLELPLMVAPITGSPLTMDQGDGSQNIYIGWDTGAYIYAGSASLTGNLILDDGEINYNAEDGERTLFSIGYPEGLYQLKGPTAPPSMTGYYAYLPEQGGVLATKDDLTTYTKQSAGAITVSSGSTGMNYLNNTIAGGYFANNIALPGNPDTGGVDIPRGSWIVFRTSSVANPAVFIASGRLAIDTNKKHMYFAVKVDNTYYGWYELAQTSDIPAAGITGISLYGGGHSGDESFDKMAFGDDYETPTLGGGLSDTLVMPLPKTKTLFGNQSITGTGNIDLYKHHINLVGRPTGDFYIDVISSKNLVVGSLADLKTLLGDTFKISAYGDYNSLPVLYMSESRLYYLENGNVNSIELSTPKLFYTDTVTTI